MKTYRPASEILPEYTDEALKQRTVYGPAAADLLLTIPAEYRQPCQVEVNARSFVHHQGASGMIETERVADPTATRKVVVAEILWQLNHPTSNGE